MWASPAAIAVIVGLTAGGDDVVGGVVTGGEAVGGGFVTVGDDVGGGVVTGLAAVGADDRAGVGAGARLGDDPHAATRRPIAIQVASRGYEKLIPCPLDGAWC